MLLAMGRWAEAEQELAAALAVSRAAEPLLHAEALVQLAGLRLAQGRTDAAARLLDGLEHYPVAAPALAAVRLRRGELDTAAAILNRSLRAIGEDCFQSAALLELLIDVELERDAVEAAVTKARSLAALGARLSAQVVSARGDRALGRALVAQGDPDAALPQLERSLATFARLELPLEAGRARLALARAMVPAQPEAAIDEARVALDGFETLGAGRDADEAAALLRTLGVKAARSGPRGLARLTKRELEVLELLGEGLSNREMAERFVLTRKTVENHVASVLGKLGLKSRAEAAVFAVRHLGQ